MLHEIGHMVGLGHVDASSQVMYPMIVGHDAYRDGDREGLWRLGAAQGCIGGGGAGAAGGPEPVVVTIAD